jgi:hypothetical protein
VKLVGLTIVVLAIFAVAAAGTGGGADVIGGVFLVLLVMALWFVYRGRTKRGS